MTIRHLEIFLSVYESLSMTEAARKLYITQPSVSQAIAELESYYDVLLFNRISNRLSPTTEAEKMHIYAENVIDALKALSSDMGKQEQSLLLRVGASNTIGETFFSSLISGFMSQNNAYRITSVVNNAPYIEHAIAENRLNIAIITSTEVSHPSIEAVHLHTDALVLVSHRKFPIKSEKFINAQTLSSLPLIVREEGSRIRQVIENLGIPITVVGEYNNSKAILKAIENNLGVSVIPKAFIASNEHKDLHYHIIDHPDFNIPYWVIYKKGNLKDPSIQIFTQYCQKFIKSFSL